MAYTPSRRIMVAPNLREIPAGKVTTQTTEGLRHALFDTMDALRNGKTTPTIANATARLAEQIVGTVQLEMEIERHAHNLGKRGDHLIDILPPVVPLGDREEASMIELQSSVDHQQDEPEDRDE